MRLFCLNDSATNRYSNPSDYSAIGLNPEDEEKYTLHRTKASHIYRHTKNIRAIQILLGYTKLESTVRYFGIEVDDALEMAEQTQV